MTNNLTPTPAQRLAAVIVTAMIDAAPGQPGKAHQYADEQLFLSLEEPAPLPTAPTCAGRNDIL